jgi:hypothetical protein
MVFAALLIFWLGPVTIIAWRMPASLIFAVTGGAIASAVGLSLLLRRVAHNTLACDLLGKWRRFFWSLGIVGRMYSALQVWLNQQVDVSAATTTDKGIGGYAGLSLFTMFLSQAFGRVAIPY